MTTTNKNKEDTFVVHDTGTIDVYSKSGAHYVISDNQCSCPGYGYRGNCRHVLEAQLLLTKREAIANAQANLTPSALRDLHIAICTGHAPHMSVPKRSK